MCRNGYESNFHSKKLMNLARINNFGLSDLAEPTSLKFMQCLSGLINFIKFTDTVRVSVHEYAEETEIAEERRQTLEDQLLQLEVTVQTLKYCIRLVVCPHECSRQKREAEKPYVVEAEQKTAQLAGQLKATFAAIETCRKEGERVKREQSALQEKIVGECGWNNASHTCCFCRPRLILQSPMPSRKISNYRPRSCTRRID